MTRKLHEEECITGNRFYILCMLNCKHVSHNVSLLQLRFVLSWENIYQHIWACFYTQCSLPCLDLCCFMGTSVCLNGQSLQGCMSFNYQHSYSGLTFSKFFHTPVQNVYIPASVNIFVHVFCWALQTALCCVWRESQSGEIQHCGSGWSYGDLGF